MLQNHNEMIVSFTLSHEAVTTQLGLESNSRWVTTRDPKGSKERLTRQNCWDNWSTNRGACGMVREEQHTTIQYNTIQ